MDQFDPGSTFEVDAPDFDWEPGPTAPQTPAQAEMPKDPPPMYEPDESPAGDNSSQWAPYDNTAFIPPQDDFDPQPIGVSPPPSGRQYDMYRQQPTWQHASLQGVEGMQVNVGGLLQGLAAIAASAGLGYALTGSLKVTAGAGLGMAGVLQLPSLLSGHFIRALVGAAAVAGAYYLLRDDFEAPALSARPNWAGDDDGDDEGWEPNEDEDDDDEDEDDDEPEGKSPPEDPSKSSPWLEED